MTILLCKTNDISDPGSIGVEIAHNGATKNVFIILKDGQFHAYINNCPHTGVNLDWQENQFLDMDNAFIQCSTHDALFEIPTGTCIAGPCVGESLTTVQINIRENSIFAVNLD